MNNHKTGRLFYEYPAGFRYPTSEERMKQECRAGYYSSLRLAGYPVRWHLTCGELADGKSWVVSIYGLNIHAPGPDDILLYPQVGLKFSTDDGVLLKEVILHELFDDLTLMLPEERLEDFFMIASPDHSKYQPNSPVGSKSANKI